MHEREGSLEASISKSLFFPPKHLLLHLGWLKLESNGMKHGKWKGAPGLNCSRGSAGNVIPHFHFHQTRVSDFSYTCIHTSHSISNELSVIACIRVLCVVQRYKKPSFGLLAPAQILPPEPILLFCRSHARDILEMTCARRPWTRPPD